MKRAEQMERAEEVEERKSVWPKTVWPGGPGGR